MQHPIAEALLSPQVAKICGPAAPHQMKAMAAGGLVPLGPQDLVTVLYALSYDKDPSLSRKAVETLGKLPPNLLLGALGGELPAAVLDGLATQLLRRADAIEVILLNRTADDGTFLELAEKLSDDRLLEIIAGNEQRLLRRPEIIEKLYCNNHTRMSTADRVVELAVRHGIELTGISAFAEVKAALEGELIAEPTAEPAPDDLVFRQNMMQEGLALEGIDLSDDWMNLQDDLGDGAQAPPDIDPEVAAKAKRLAKSLSNLTVSQKIRLATLGNSSQRAVMLRDSNKLVIMAVVKSPGVTETEVVRFAQARSLPDEAVRYIAHNREWTKSYSVKLSLVQNPRCPLSDSLRFLQHLRPNDVRQLEHNKNVPQSVAAAARALSAKRH